jgi:hypothetical protein
MTVSALAIDGAAIAIVPSAAITYPNFFMLSSSSYAGKLTSHPGQRSRGTGREF